MDATDIKILDLLQRDGRMTHSEIAKTVGLSAPSVGERIKKLEAAGIIQRYVTLVSPGRVGRPLMAFIEVTLSKPVHAKEFLARIRELADILECYHVTGDHDYLLKVRTASQESLEKLITEDLRPLEGVSRTHTTLVLSTHKEETRIKLELPEE